jgi:signal transduction histidine kinase
MSEGAPPTPGAVELRNQNELRAQFDAAGAQVLAAMDGLNKVEMFRLRTGQSTTVNLRQRVASAQAAGRAWVAAPRNPETIKAASSEYFALHELVERMETANLTGMTFEVSMWRTIRPVLVLILVASLLDAMLAGALGVVLVRRWVVHPVRVLRAAADRLSRGDFAHRVPVTGRDELGLLSAEINHMAGMISSMQEERVDRERLAAVGEMVRRLAHNLRNPLAGIRSLAELARAEVPVDSAVRETQDRIVETVDRFERWLKELLSATTPLSVVPQETAVASWLEQCLKPLRPLARAKGIELILVSERAPPSARIDARHMEQALVSVVTNAIQASPVGKPVRVTATAADSSDYWEIRIEDQGSGVHSSLTERIFRPYFTTKRDGSGIGLAVAKQVVEQHGGQIWVENASLSLETGVGASTGAAFIMRLPLAKPGEEYGAVARFGQGGEDSGNTPDRRRRGESPVLDPADSQASGA